MLSYKLSSVSSSLALSCQNNTVFSVLTLSSPSVGSCYKPVSRIPVICPTSTNFSRSSRGWFSMLGFQESTSCSSCWESVKERGGAWSSIGCSTVISRRKNSSRVERVDRQSELSLLNVVLILTIRRPMAVVFCSSTLTTNTDWPSYRPIHHMARFNESLSTKETYLFK